MSEQQLSLKTTKSKLLHKEDQKNYLPTFKRLPIAFEKGEGCYLWDVDGNRYLDALAGIAVTSLGHSHPKVIEAIKGQADQMLHISNFFVSPAQVELSQALTSSTDMDHVFFTNSGTESFEGAIKLARKYAHSKGKGGTIVSMDGAFHGRTLAAIAAGKPKMQKGFGPIPQGFTTIPFNNIEAARSIMSNDIAAIILEPIQGEGGVHPADRKYLEELRQLCHDHDVVLIFDEIQCGMGRTGHLLASQYYNIQPDIITLAKALGNGFPIGAILNNKKIGNAIDFGDHGTTFGGNPLACATALSALKEINNPVFLHDVRQKSAFLVSNLQQLKIEFDDILDVRGVGLMVGVEFAFDVAPLVMKMLENGVIANGTSGNVLRLVPPLIISKDQIITMVNVIKDSILQLKEESK